MNVLLIPVGSHGDVHPIVGIGRALHGRGHRVTVMTNGHFEPLVRRCGLEFIELGTDEEYQAIMADPRLWDPMWGWKVVFEQGTLPSVRPMFDAVAEYFRSVGGDAIAVGASLALGARVAQEALGVPLATVHLQPSIFRSVYETPRLPGAPMAMVARLPAWAKRQVFRFADWKVVDPVIAPPLNAFRAEHGLAPASRIADSYWHSPELVIGLWPAWFAAPQPDWPPQARLTGFPLFDERGLEPLPAGLKAFLSEGEPPVAFTPGSAMRHGQGFFEASADACRRLGRRGVLLTRHREQIPPALPPGVIHVDFAPFSELLPRCAALVHHGGIGTMAQAMAAGVPQLIMPLSHDQPDNADRVRRLGIGAGISPKAYNGPRVARELEMLINSPRVQESCRVVKARFAGIDPLGQTCELLEDFARRRGVAPTRVPVVHAG